MENKDLRLCTFKTPTFIGIAFLSFLFCSWVYIYLSYDKHLPLCSYNSLLV